MIVQQTPLHKTPLLSKLILDYCHSKSELSELVNNLPAQKNWNRQIQEKEMPIERRQNVHSVLIDQYTNSGLLNSSRKQSIDKLLSANTFTVCTGHQLNLLTGPAYFIYKIAGCIKQAQAISKESGKTVLPVYWMASEDHDWDEINHTYLWRNKLSWDKEVQGPVGRTPLHGLKEVVHEFKTILGNSASEVLSQAIDKALNKSNNLAQFTFILVDAIFAQHELLILDADSADLKRQFIPVMEDELLNNPSLGQVQKHSKILETLGHKAQVTAREINLFYIEDDLRERIVAVENGFSSSSNTYHWTSQELLELLQSNPEKFSPNVVLRPLYQEFTLPNLAYIGGPGELSYWLQLKGVFDHFNVVFPQLVLRNYALFIKAKDVEKMKGLGLNISD
ncbi:MAG: bacillithiol biosynthesis cysteine-adding enzyme BshC, partial [Flavobacteriales bacterium]